MGREPLWRSHFTDRFPWSDDDDDDDDYGDDDTNADYFDEDEDDDSGMTNDKNIRSSPVRGSDPESPTIQSLIARFRNSSPMPREKRNSTFFVPKGDGSTRRRDVWWKEDSRHSSSPRYSPPTSPSSRVEASGYAVASGGIDSMIAGDIQTFKRSVSNRKKKGTGRKNFAPDSDSSADAERDFDEEIGKLLLGRKFSTENTAHGNRPSNSIPRSPFALFPNDSPQSTSSRSDKDTDFESNFPSENAANAIRRAGVHIQDVMSTALNELSSRNNPSSEDGQGHAETSMQSLSVSAQSIIRDLDCALGLFHEKFPKQSLMSKLSMKKNIALPAEAESEAKETHASVEKEAPTGLGKIRKLFGKSRKESFDVSSEDSADVESVLARLELQRQKKESENKNSVEEASVPMWDTALDFTGHTSVESQLDSLHKFARLRMESINAAAESETSVSFDDAPLVSNSIDNALDETEPVQHSVPCFENICQTRQEISKSLDIAILCLRHNLNIDNKEKCEKLENLQKEKQNQEKSAKKKELLRIKREKEQEDSQRAKLRVMGASCIQDTDDGYKSGASSDNERVQQYNERTHHSEINETQPPKSPSESIPFLMARCASIPPSAEHYQHLDHFDSVLKASRFSMHDVPGSQWAEIGRSSFNDRIAEQWNAPSPINPRHQDISPAGYSRRIPQHSTFQPPPQRMFDVNAHQRTPAGRKGAFKQSRLRQSPIQDLGNKLLSDLESFRKLRQQKYVPYCYT